MQARAYEWEALPELEGEWEMEGEWEGELELEGEMESEEFFGRLAGLARRAVPALRRVGLQAARSALTGGGRQLGQQVGGAMGGSWGPRLANLGGDLGSWAGGYLPQQEFEGEWEGEWEARPAPASIAARVLMEHLGHAATQAESEEEAEAFIGALIPLAAQILPRVAPAVLRAAPQLIRGAASVVRTLRSNPATRQLVRTVPTIVGRTVQSLGSQIAQGRPLTGQTAARTLARQTQRVLGNPQQAVQAYRRSRALDRRYHGQARPPQTAAGPQMPAAMPQHACSCGGNGLPGPAPTNPEGYF
jgi:hypothetical protein